LSEKNPNATRISTPPHATGLAFDVYNFFMTAAEQDYLMEVVAHLKTAGRVEALRENRDHIHVFAFADGTRPDEKLIASAIPQAGAKAVASAKSKKTSKPAHVARNHGKARAAAQTRKGRH
jgi:hypothetical protein